MSNVIQLVQGSSEWLAYRRAKRNASESAAVMGLSPWCTPYALWLLKTGRSEPAVSKAMTHGTEMEPAARRAYEAQTGLVMQPLVLEDGSYSASLDGMTIGGDLVLEIKCPFQGRNSALWQAAVAGIMAQHYDVQVQHQLMVSGASRAHLWVFDGHAGVLLEVAREEGRMEAIRLAWDAFQQYLDKDQPPPLSHADTVLREDPAWLASVAAFTKAKRAADVAAKALEAAREALVTLTSHPRETGAGVSVTRFWKAGSVDYKRVPELAGLDLDAYRGKGREEVRITV